MCDLSFKACVKQSPEHVEEGEKQLSAIMQIQLEECLCFVSNSCFEVVIKNNTIFIMLESESAKSLLKSIFGETLVTTDIYSNQMMKA